ncbi:uncharacterized protein [Ptychodera flava]|uniref:uncharacterized protein n=1 Tax=Ptychodera flava TaxID=63121 RepID=UPI00396A85B7
MAEGQDAGTMDENMETSTQDTSTGESMEGQDSQEEGAQGQDQPHQDMQEANDESKAVTPARDEPKIITHEWLVKNVFKDTETCLLWCVDRGLLCWERICTKCRDKQTWTKDITASKQDGFVFRCGRPCRSKNGLRKGTWFEGSKLSIKDILSIIYWWCFNLPQTYVQVQLNITEHSTVDWYSYCREVCAMTLERCSEHIGGPGKVVEIDESKLGKRKHVRGQQTTKKWVFGGVEVDSHAKKLFLVTVGNTDTDTLLPIILHWVAPGTTIISDFWKDKETLEGHGYTHVSSNSKAFKDLRTETCTDTRGRWLNVKRGLPKFGTPDEHHTTGRFAEWLYRQRFGPKATMFQTFLDHIHELHPGR